MGKKFEKVKNHYNNGFWTKDMVWNAVKKGWITVEEYESIINNKQGGNNEIG